MQQEIHLSKHDLHILGALFDPELSLSTSAPVDASKPALPHLDEDEFASIRAEEQMILKLLHGSSQTADTIDRAIQQLTGLITRSPGFAPAYFNRAQARRLFVTDDNLFTEEFTEQSRFVFADLQSTITLATPLSPQASLSIHQQSLLASVHAHRGLLLMKAVQRAENGFKVYGLPDELCKPDKDSIEDAASRDFFFGGRYGDKDAQQMSVKTNPYAKMCGAIVKQAMRQEIEEGMEKV